MWTPERLDGVYSYSAFRSSSVTGRCSLNIKFLSQKIGALQTGYKTQNADFLENGSNGFDWISVMYGDHVLKLHASCVQGTESTHAFMRTDRATLFPTHGLWKRGNPWKPRGQIFFTRSQKYVRENESKFHGYMSQLVLLLSYRTFPQMFHCGTHHAYATLPPTHCV